MFFYQQIHPPPPTQQKCRFYIDPRSVVFEYQTNSFVLLLAEKVHIIRRYQGRCLLKHRN